MHDRSGPGRASAAGTRRRRASRPRGTAGFGALVTASLIVTTAANLSPTLVSALAVQIEEDLGIGEAEIGMTVSAFFFVGVLSSALAGRMVERTGPAVGLRMAAATAGAMLAATGALGRSWPALLVLVAVSGLANAWAQPAANLYVARGVSGRRQGLALGIQKSGIPTASLLGGLAIPTVGTDYRLALGLRAGRPPSPRCVAGRSRRRWGGTHSQRRRVVRGARPPGAGPTCPCAC